MLSKIIVAGGRTYKNYEFVAENCRKFIADNNVYYPEIVTGTDLIKDNEPYGVDQLSVKFAREHGYEYTIFKAEWSTYGSGAGPIRNGEMAVYGDVLLAFWDGNTRGTKNMIDQAKKRGVPVHIYHI